MEIVILVLGVLVGFVLGRRSRSGEVRDLASRCAKAQLACKTIACAPKTPAKKAVAKKATKKPAAKKKVAKKVAKK